MLLLLAKRIIKVTNQLGIFVPLTISIIYIKLELITFRHIKISILKYYNLLTIILPS